MTLKLFQISIKDDYLYDIVPLLIRYGNLIFSEYQNPVSVFLTELEMNKSRIIVLVQDEFLLGFVVLHNFHKISENEFYCYIYGAAVRGVANLLQKALSEIFKSLKRHGCVCVRCETYKYNMPMRFLANRLKFRKVGTFSKSVKQNEKYFESILYEKIL